MYPESAHASEGKKVLVLGTYGLLGAGITSHLSKQGFLVTGLGRDRQTAERVLPYVDWIIDDLRNYTKPEDWHGALENIVAVVNCSGALQDGPSDGLEHIHFAMVKALAVECEKRGIHLVQISAVGASLDASTEFLSSKARGDQAIKASGVAYTILRPGLVLAPNAYGGSALLRMLAAVPIVQAVSYSQAKIQTVSLADLAKAIELALDNRLPEKFECDLVESETHNLQDVVTKTRRWLGFEKAHFNINVPNAAAKLISKCADALSWLGWKSPLRSTGVQVLEEGVLGDAADWKGLKLFNLSSIDETLGKMPATSADRLSARLSLLLPFLVGVLSLFWIVSGLVGLVSLDQATRVLKDVGWSSELATLSVIFWAIVDIALGGAILVRKFAKVACLAMVATAVFYLMASTFVVPQLWLDPLGPLVKVVPSIFLALVTKVALEKR